ncbi:hypothetical protein P2G74_01450 [Cronobacter muytjensii]|uniref:hypothetical protein n=1 Tax=Cronobacter muytjensii TaxID=413501 RepID=UPI002DBA3B86|nr:hypothetical protein [Cronobacter muytjensii]MEB8638638.1 hypothetical protein [Cronobacter muytjensii]
MATLGDSFPAGFKQGFVQGRGISPGDVLYLHCDFVTPPKVKFMLVACCDPFLVLLINSNIHEFIQNDPEQLECQVDLPVADHDFLDWDSFINCISAHSAFDLNTIKAAVAADYGRVLKGRVADYCMREVYVAVERSKAMLRKHKKSILAALDGFKPD